MRSCIFAGSFDPITLGHKDIVMRAARDFDSVYVAVAGNTEKNTASLKCRLELVNKALANIAGVKVLDFEGSLPALCRALKTFVIVRGIRNIIDFEYEKELLSIYKSQDDRIDCLYYLSIPEMEHISSSAVRQISALGGDISEYVPESIVAKVAQIYGRGEKYGGVV